MIISGIDLQTKEKESKGTRKTIIITYRMDHATRVGMITTSIIVTVGVIMIG